ncbi:MAG TPA: thiamine pyrophosphate-dependent enzyme [Candidatus Bathyarchaeia archaeon]|nr:thiamine pyrophosphate-dependent enzyme [Candidatus Bathyarchaeia archaeon]
MLELKQYRTQVHNDWCPGCGDFGIVNAIQMTLLEMQLEPHKVAVFSGIGCSGKTPHFIHAYGFHTLHGRVLPIATGARLANPGLTVIAVGGDGDGLGIGAGHFMNTGRRNLDFTYLLYDNGVYGLTKGQASPTLPKGIKTKSMPQPSIVEGVNPIAMAVASGYTFVARSYALDVRHLKQTLRAAIEHRGSAFIDALQTCPTYNDINTKEWYAGDDLSVKQPRLYKLEETGFNGVVSDPSNQQEINEKKGNALLKSFEWGDKIPIGVFFKMEVPTFEDQLAQRMPTLKEKPFVEQDIYDRDVTPLFEELA